MSLRSIECVTLLFLCVHVKPEQRRCRHGRSWEFSRCYKFSVTQRHLWIFFTVRMYLKISHSVFLYKRQWNHKEVLFVSLWLSDTCMMWHRCLRNKILHVFVEPTYFCLLNKLQFRNIKCVQNTNSVYNRVVFQTDFTPECPVSTVCVTSSDLLLHYGKFSPGLIFFMFKLNLTY